MVSIERQSAADPAQALAERVVSAMRRPATGSAPGSSSTSCR